MLFLLQFMNYFNFIIMKYIFILTALLFSMPFCLSAQKINDTLAIVKISREIIVKHGNIAEGRRYINFLLEDGRVVVLEDIKKDLKSNEPMSDKGRIYKNGIKEGAFKTTLSTWKKAYSGKKVVIRSRGRKYRCYLL